ncbi:MAG TPA: FtsQ-type POTRA domain-containing protein [Acidimicrobiales bacterium]|nr:FtsQ-type POTRA domain-containing protein [Acidimicrobiales bacterium]
MSASPTSARPRVGIDPRIKRRRIEVLRTEGRKRLRNFAAAFGVVALAAGAVGATRSPLLDVDYVDATGIEHTPRQELLAATGLDRHPLLIDLDTEQLAAAARRLPWIATAKAEKQWPGTVRFEITERVARAVVRTEAGQWALADVEGRVLEVVPERPPGLPAISKAGLPGAPGTMLAKEAAAPLAVAAALPDAVRDKVGEVVAAEGDTIELNLWPSGVVRLGPPDQLPAKMEALATMLTKADLRRLSVLDLRVPTAPVLTRR